MEIEQLKNVGIKDLSLVGGKNASLGEMIKNLTPLGINIPDGFVITTICYKNFMENNGLKQTIQQKLADLDPKNLVDLRRTGLEIRMLIHEGEFLPNTEAQIIEAYAQLSANYKDVHGNPQKKTDVAVRSSGTAEDLQDASFAGQQETYLNVRGKYQLLDAIKNCFASLYTDRAISYRHSVGYNGDVALSVCVQKMVRSDLGSAGVAFSIDTESGFKDLVLINGAWGLGELVVSGNVKPDEFIVYKNKLQEGYASIIDKKLGDKDKLIVYGTNPDEKTKTIAANKDKQASFCLEDNMITLLSQWVCLIEDYYTKAYGRWTPIDTEWALDGLSGELFIVQARPETVHANDAHTLLLYKIDKTVDTKILISGVAVGDRIGTGTVKIIHSLDNRGRGDSELDFKDGDVLVTDITDPDWEPIMRKASAIVTNRGGRCCHAAIIAREMGICAVVGTGNATEVLKENSVVTVSCAEGEVGYIYEGIIPYTKDEHVMEEIPRPKTKIMFNCASPSEVFKFHNYPVDGVGLVREEFIINNFIGVHPLALLDYDKIENDVLKMEIDKLTIGYPDKSRYYVDKLAFGLARIAATFYPNEVIVRFSDFKSNEYRNLLGGVEYEPLEENPMIGWRGASRYYDPKFRNAFGLECLAIKKVREQMGLDNVVVMIPFCRTVEELMLVKEVMAEYGLQHQKTELIINTEGVKRLKLFIMCEIPSNVIMADLFCEEVDGFSIGSNDLTQLTLGLDRDSGLVAHIYNERNPAVKWMISHAIKTCKKHGVKIGICGQGPSDYPDFAQFLVQEGIDSISIVPDAYLKTAKAIWDIEQQI
jgi:pyruvate, water dikinase